MGGRWGEIERKEEEGQVEEEHEREGVMADFERHDLIWRWRWKFQVLKRGPSGRMDIGLKILVGK